MDRPQQRVEGTIYATTALTVRALIKACVVGMLVVASVSCSDGRAPASQVGTAIRVGNSVQADTRVLRLGRVGVFSQPYRVDQPLVLKSIRPHSISDGLELLASRISYISRRPSVRDRTAVNGYPGITCSDTWPLKSFGPTYQPEGQTLAVDDYFAVIYYVRILRAGDWNVRGTVFEYTQNSEPRQQIADNTDFIARGSESGVMCGNAKSIWLGTQ